MEDEKVAGTDMPIGSPHPSPVQSSMESVFREERGRLLASLVRRFGDLDLAEEVASEAVEAALVHWPVGGVPARPGAWLLTDAGRPAQADRHEAVHAGSTGNAGDVAMVTRPQEPAAVGKPRRE